MRPPIFSYSFGTQADVMDIFNVDGWDNYQIQNNGVGGGLFLDSTYAADPLMPGQTLACASHAYDGVHLPKASIAKSIYPWVIGDQFFAEWKMRITSAANFTFFNFMDFGGQVSGTNAEMRLYMNTALQWKVQREGTGETTVELPGTPACPLDQWIRVRVYYKIHSDPTKGKIAIWRDTLPTAGGATLIMSANATTITAPIADRFEIGHAAINSTADNISNFNEIKVWNQPPRWCGLKTQMM